MTTARTDEIDIQPLPARTGYRFRRRLAIGRRFGSFPLLSAACITHSEPAVAQNRPPNRACICGPCRKCASGYRSGSGSARQLRGRSQKLILGAAFGVRTYFRKTGEWKELSHQANLSAYILERSILYSATGNTYSIAGAFRGKEIKQAITDFFQASTGSQQKPPIALTGPDGKPIQLNRGVWS